MWTYVDYRIIHKERSVQGQINDTIHIFLFFVTLFVFALLFNKNRKQVLHRFYLRTLTKTNLSGPCVDSLKRNFILIVRMHAAVWWRHHACTTTSTLSPNNVRCEPVDTQLVVDIYFHTKQLPLKCLILKIRVYDLFVNYLVNTTVHSPFNNNINDVISMFIA